MSKIYTILVTGVGAIVGQGIIKSLRLSSIPCRIIGLDKNPKAFGFKDCETHYIKPFAEEDSRYKDFLKQTILDEHIDLIIPGLDIDVFYFNNNKGEHWNTKIVLNSEFAIECGYDKFTAYNALKDKLEAIIPSAYDVSFEMCQKSLGSLPYLLKPRRGSGSRGHALIYDKGDYEYWVKKSLGNYIIQKIVGNEEEEYTVSVFGFGDGTSTKPAIFRRKLAGTGATMKAETVLADVTIKATVLKLNQILKPIGPTNYQFRKEDEKVYLLEINPRVSASTSLRALLGVNEARMCIEYYLQDKKPEDSSLQNGYAERFVEDYVVYL